MQLRESAGEAEQADRTGHGGHHDAARTTSRAGHEIGISIVRNVPTKSFNLQAHVGLFQLLAVLGAEPVVSPRTEFVCR